MKSIKTKILGITIISLFISLLVVSTIFSVLNIKSTEYTLEAALRETAETAALAVQNGILASKNTIQELGVNRTLWSADVPLEEKQALLNGIRDAHAYQMVSTTDENGRTAEGEDVSQQEFFQRAIQGETFISTPIVNQDGSSAQIIVSAPVWNGGMRNTQAAGVVFCILDGTYLSDLIETVTMGETGYPYMIDGEGTTIADTEYEWVLEEENTIQSISEDDPPDSLVELELKAIGGEGGFGIAHYDGVKRFLTTTPVPGTDNWVMGIMVDYDEFMERPIQAIWICVGVSLVALVLAVLLSMRFAGRLARPIVEMERAIVRIAEGDYDVVISYEAEDEIGSMASSTRRMVQSNSAIIRDAARVLGEIAQGNFNVVPSVEFIGIFKDIETHMTRLIVSLSETLSDIQASSNQVASGAEQVSMSAQSLSQGATEQAASLQQLSALVGEVSGEAGKTAENTAVSAQMADEAGDGAVRSQQSMGQMLEAMEDISKQSDEIGRIIKAIDDLAFQTNILALNAAVEAARAGQAGKGFAVVAEEVRNLAQRSAEAAKNTTDLIGGTVRSVERGTTIAGEAAERLNEVVEKFSSLHENINTIAAASGRQTEAITQITVGIDQISTVVQNNSATSEESAAASEELSGQAQILNDLIRRFVLYQSEQSPVLEPKQDLILENSLFIEGGSEQNNAGLSKY